MITILTWLWGQPNGRAEYGVDSVCAWAEMVRRNITMPHRIACVTDFELPSHIERIEPPRDFENIRIPTWNEKKPQCLRRLSMYSPDAGKTFGERFVCMDLDVVISGPLDPLFDVKDDFKMMIGTDPKRRPYNGSMQLMTAGSRPQIYTDFTPERATLAGKHFIGSDQAWICFCLGWGESVWDERDGAIWYSPRYSAGVPDSTRIMFFPGTPKPWQVAGSQPLDRWVQRHYRTMEAA